MKRSAKLWLIIGIVLVVAGGAVFCLAMSMNGWDISKIGISKYETRTAGIEDEFRDIYIESVMDDIVFAVSEDGKCSIEFRETENLRHDVQVKDGVLSITTEDTRPWFMHLFSFSSTSIVLNLPQKEYASLTVKDDTGDVRIPLDFTFEKVAVDAGTGDVTYGAGSSGPIHIALSTGNITLTELEAQSLDLAVSTGSIDVSSVSCSKDINITVTTGGAALTDVTCESLITSGSTGEMALENVIAENSMSIDRSTGDISFDRCDAGEITVNTSTGDVTGTLLSDKVFIAHSSAGNIDLPETVDGGVCRITTSTGDIRIKIN